MFKNFTSLRQKTLIALVLFTLVITSGQAFAQDPLKSSAPAIVSVSNQDLVQDISVGIMRVPEFVYIQQEARRMGVKAYLFGGTASTFAHYVRLDLMRLHGDTRILEERFSYDMVDIFRNNQDFDIVLDGTPDQVERLQNLLKQNFPHSQDDHTAWEVRSLRHAMGPKAALLGNPDFLNQHTDSNSTAMIDLSAGSQDLIKDLRDWNNPRPQFLTDVLEGKIHYFYSHNHESTQMARDGNNPAIVSVVRLLVKALQFDLEIRPEDLPAIAKVINAFDPASIRNNKYVQRRLTSTALKLVANSVNVERTIDLLEQLQLKSKLLAVVRNEGSTEAVRLLSKEPLRAKNLGEGVGKTAQELGLTVVAHDTNSLEAYYSIIRSPTGQPNVFISRDNINGETARFGDGFYVQVGKYGAIGNRLTIRFQLNPNAREGSDFRYVRNEGYLVIHNKNALMVIPELTKMSLLQMAEQFSYLGTEKHILIKIYKKIQSQLHTESDEEIAKFRSHILSSPQLTPAVLDLINVCQKNPRCADDRIANFAENDATKKEQGKTLGRELIDLDKKSLKNNPALLSKFIAALSGPGSTSALRNQAVEYVRLNDRATQEKFLNQTKDIYISGRPEFFEKINLRNFPEIAEALADTHDAKVTQQYLKQNSEAAQLVIMNRLMANGKLLHALDILPAMNLKNRPDLLPILISTMQAHHLDDERRAIVTTYFSQNGPKEQAAVAEAFAQKEVYDLPELLAKTSLKNRPDLLPALENLAQLKQLKEQHIELLKKYCKNNSPAVQSQLLDTLSMSHGDDVRNIMAELKISIAPPVTKTPAAPQPAKVLSPLNNPLGLKDLMNSPAPETRVAATVILKSHDAANLLIEMISNESSKHNSNPDVYAAIFKALQNNGSAKNIAAFDRQYNAFKAATGGGLKNRLMSLVGKSNGKELEALWQQTRYMMANNNIAVASGPVCTAIFQ
jgi:hypothetical protein